MKLKLSPDMKIAIKAIKQVFKGGTPVKPPKKEKPNGNKGR